MNTKFLKNPAMIRQAISDLQRYTRELDLAVAFVGADWRNILSNYDGKIRLICWLQSTNTNPHAVEQMMKRPNTEIRRRRAMHCKVYLAPEQSAVVCSANLSRTALAEDENEEQDEAGVLVVDRAILTTIKQWFEALWNDPDTYSIEDSDLTAAKTAYDQSPKERERTRLGTASAPRQHQDLPNLKDNSENEEYELGRFIKVLRQDHAWCKAHPTTRLGRRFTSREYERILYLRDPQNVLQGMRKLLAPRRDRQWPSGLTTLFLAFGLDGINTRSLEARAVEQSHRSFFTPDQLAEAQRRLDELRRSSPVRSKRT